jgi:hypothetical protein
MALATAAVAVEGRSSETASKIARKGSFDVIRFMVATPGRRPVSRTRGDSLLALDCWLIAAVLLV